MKETMDAEVLQVAREAVAALQQPNWAEVVQLVVNSGGLGAIFWGLFQMQAAGERRNKEIDVLGKALERQGRALEELLRRSA